MKRSKRLTREQKIRLSTAGYDPSQYVYARRQDGCEIYVDKYTGENMVLGKGEGE